MVIKVENNGSEITSTNFWESAFNSNGLMLMSINKNSFRLLVPENCKDFDLKELMTGKDDIILSFGKLYGRSALEILFDDHTNSPYSIHIGTDQMDRLPIGCKRSETYTFIIYQKGLKKVLETTCHYRNVNLLPCLKAW